jgi:hypothetical protein
MPRIFSIIRNRSHAKDTTVEVPGDAIKRSLNRSNRPRFIRNGSSKIFRRIKSSKKLKNSLKESRNGVVGLTDTFSLSEDESSSATSSLFSPVNIDTILTGTSSLSQNNVQLLTSKSLLVSPMAHNDNNDDNDNNEEGEEDVIKRSPKVFPAVIEGESFVEDGKEEDEAMEEEGVEDKGAKQKEEVKQAVVGEEETAAIVDQLSTEIAYLQHLLKDIQTLHVIDMELKDTEILKTKIAFQKSQNELSIAHSELKAQSDLIDILTTAIISPLPAVPTPASQPSYYAAASALPELFYDSLI